MYNLKIYQICHDLIAYFATLTSPKKSQLGLIFRTRGSKREIFGFWTRRNYKMWFGPKIKGEKKKEDWRLAPRAYKLWS